MNKTELIAAVAQEAEMTKKDAEKAVKAVLDVVSNALVKGDKVQLIGFGTFEVRQRKDRVGHKPSTQKEKKIPTSKTPPPRLNSPPPQPRPPQSAFPNSCKKKST